MRFRKCKNGDLVAVPKGKPPAPPSGYYQDAKYPLVYHPILTDCMHRKLVNKKKECCNSFTVSLFCAYKNEFITQNDCEGCDHASEGDSTIRQRT